MSLLACPGSYDIWWVRCQSTSETAPCSQGAVFLKYEVRSKNYEVREVNKGKRRI